MSKNRTYRQRLFTVGDALVDLAYLTITALFVLLSLWLISALDRL